MKTNTLLTRFGILAFAFTITLTLMPIWAAASTPDHNEVLSKVSRRLIEEHGPERVKSLSGDQIVSALRPDERATLGQGHIRFTIDATSFVTVFRSEASADATYWLEDRGFKPTDDRIVVGDTPYAGFRRAFDVGEVNLGIGAWDEEIYPYFVTVRPTRPDASVNVSEWSPRQMKTAAVAVGAEPFADRGIRITSISSGLDGDVLIRTSRSYSRDTSLLGQLLVTTAKSTASADQITLTLGEDPKSQMNIQWRTSPDIAAGVLALRATDEGRPVLIPARSRPLHTPDVINDPVVHLHTVALDRLQPNTSYQYCIGSSEEGPWTEWKPFRTAPGPTDAFSFVYIGDAQNGLDQWGQLLQTIDQRHSDARFYLLPGDLVDRGHSRDDWDAFFRNGSPVFSRRPLVPTIGNHESLKGLPPLLYRSFFQLPDNGPRGIDPGHAYTFEYGDVLFVILDSNLEPATQTEWLDETLGRSKAKWKLVSFHHPLYPSHPTRSNDRLVKEWGDIIDKHRVDMVLQGHDHAYLRTHPMRGGQKVTPSDGTYYVVSVSGTKFYEQADRPYTAVGFVETPTYQVINVTTDSLHFRAFDLSGAVRDEVLKRKESTR